jgi:hypothetical protein
MHGGAPDGDGSLSLLSFGRRRPRSTAELPLPRLDTSPKGIREVPVYRYTCLSPSVPLPPQCNLNRFFFLGNTLAAYNGRTIKNHT